MPCTYNYGFVRLRRTILHFRPTAVGANRDFVHLAASHDGVPTLSTIASDTLPFLRQDRLFERGRIAHFMPSLQSHARWGEALRSTVALWLFVLLVFLPIIIQRH